MITPIKKAMTEIKGRVEFNEVSHEYEDGVPVVYSEFDINRAETGRMASSSPNLQNVPVRETPEFRECFIARPGNSLVIADYSAQEPRVTAFLSQDKKFMEVFNRGEDIYIYMAKEIFHEDLQIYAIVFYYYSAVGILTNGRGVY